MAWKYALALAAALTMAQGCITTGKYIVYRERGKTVAELPLSNTLSFYAEQDDMNGLRHEPWIGSTGLMIKR